MRLDPARKSFSPEVGSLPDFFLRESVLFPVDDYMITAPDGAVIKPVVKKKAAHQAVMLRHSGKKSLADCDDLQGWKEIAYMIRPSR